MDLTRKQKLQFTTEFELEKGIHEILSEIYHEEKYEGMIEIEWGHKQKQKKQQLELWIKANKIPAIPAKRKDCAVYFHVSREKGVKKL